MITNAEKTGDTLLYVLDAVDKMGDFEMGFHDMVKGMYKQCKTDHEFINGLVTLSVLFNTYASFVTIIKNDLNSGKDKEDIILDIYKIIKNAKII